MLKRNKTTAIIIIIIIIIHYCSLISDFVSNKDIHTHTGIAVSCGIQADPSRVSRNVIYLALLAWENSSTAIG